MLGGDRIKHFSEDPSNSCLCISIKLGLISFRKLSVSRLVSVFPTKRVFPVQTFFLVLRQKLNFDHLEKHLENRNQKFEMKLLDFDGRFFIGLVGSARLTVNLSSSPNSNSKRRLMTNGLADVSN